MANARSTAADVGNDFATRARTLAVISPHLDDAVFGCGALLATLAPALVVTVFAGIPRTVTRAPSWDRQCGFRSAQAAVRARRREDRAALAALRCEPVWQDFLDSQYRLTPSVDVIAHALRRELESRAPDVIAMPLGLFHSDHRLVHAACLAIAHRLPRPRWIAYEDALYRRQPGLVQDRLADLRGARVRATPLALPHRRDAGARKARAVQCYASQARALDARALADTAAPERYWALEFDT